MYFWRNYMYFRWSCSLTERYKCSRMYTGRVSPVHNRECGWNLFSLTYKHMYFSRIPIRGLGQVPGIPVSEKTLVVREKSFVIYMTPKFHIVDSVYSTCSMLHKHSFMHCTLIGVVVPCY